MNHLLKALIISVVSIGFISCNASRMPEFTDAGQTVNQLKNRYQCERIEFENWEDGDATDSTLTICLINSHSVSAAADVDASYNNLKGIAAQIRSVLKQPERYKSYSVIFVIREGNFLFGSSSHTAGGNIPATDL